MKTKLRMKDIDNYRWELYEKEIRGKPAFCAALIRDTPKGKYAKEKTEWSYFYRDEKSRDAKVKESIANVVRFQTEKKKYKAEKSKLRKAMKNPYKIGDILYDSWGYDQTNIDFYQVVGTKPKSIVIRRIASRDIACDGYGPFGGKCAALKDEFIGKPELKHLIPPYKEGAEPGISSRHGCISRWSGEPEYYSWGH